MVHAIHGISKHINTGAKGFTPNIYHKEVTTMIVQHNITAMNAKEILKEKLTQELA